MQPELDKILRYLGNCEPFYPGSIRNKLERSAKRVSRALLWIGGACFLAALLLTGWNKFIGPVPDFLRLAAILLLLASVICTLFSFVIEPTVFLLRIRRWKEDARDATLHELATDHRHITPLLGYGEDALQFAKHWLLTKIGRIDGRITQFFGKETALFSQFGIAYAILKEGGGLPWLSSTVAHGLVEGNYVNTAILWALAFVFGLSLGAIWLRAVQGLSKYQLELVDLALKQKQLLAARQDPREGLAKRSRHARWQSHRFYR
ncbi:hypothetical protein LMG23992_04471 [Cupriavidus laharis]|uniref:Uncharacterized protein n=1 Tax=Cupriavidus laharis TaxID=151654 RepID=A0ABM8XM32_9BURK|nr:hypothetical protein [Cupriavidus laharis]CAG9181302.1 hypothetical protein LMG23992_04471 [Cupriavidus laharis]